MGVSPALRRHAADVSAAPTRAGGARTPDAQQLVALLRRRTHVVAALSRSRPRRLSDRRQGVALGRRAGLATARSRRRSCSVERVFGARRGLAGLTRTL